MTDGEYTDGTKRPFQDTRTQEQWDFECIESAVYELLPNLQPSQQDSITVSSRAVYRQAKNFDGFKGSVERVRKLLDNNELDSVQSKPTDGGYIVQRSMGSDTE